MFGRRLKIFLIVLGIAILTLLVRGATIQLTNRDWWKKQMTDAMKRPHLVDTTRGRILDRMDRPLAIDQPCIDAAVDYRVIESPPDEKWVEAEAGRRLD